MTLKIQPRSSIPTAQPSSPTTAPKRPVPTAPADGFEATSSAGRALPTPPPPDQTVGQQAVDLARSVLGQTAHNLKLANSTPIGKAMQDWPADNVNCANFVSGVLIASGQISQSQGSAGVTNLKNNLKQAGWQQVDPSQAQPGDVIVLIRNGKEQHVEMVQGVDANGKLNLIGSNNINADGTQSISENKYPSSYWSGAIVLHNPNSGQPGTATPTQPSTPGTTPTTPSTPSGGASNVDGITADQSTWLRGNSSGPAVEDLQKKLAAAGFDPGGADGKFGPKTLEAVKAFQASKGLSVDGIVGPETRAALLGQAAPSSTTPASSGAQPAPPSTTPSTSGATPAPPVVTDGTESPAFQKLAAEAAKKNGPEFVNQVKAMSQRLGIKPEWMLAVMKNESGFDSKAVNKTGGATGLIQFMPATARGLGTTTAELARMSPTDQLKYVEKYFSASKGKIKSGADLYMATFWPAGVGKPDDYKIGGETVARQNKIFDLDKNGQITAGEFRQYYKQRFPELS